MYRLNVSQTPSAFEAAFVWLVAALLTLGLAFTTPLPESAVRHGTSSQAVR